MSFTLTEEQLQVRDLVRRVARERVAPRAAAIDASGEYPQDMFDLLRESLRRQAKLYRKFNTMRRVYREALPVLTSKQKWETVLLEQNSTSNG